MSDLIFLALTFVLFAATFGLIALCRGLEKKS
jgi:hypothetical protein